MSIFRRKQNSDPVDTSEFQPSQADIEGAWGLGPATEGSIRMVGSNATPLAIAENEIEQESVEDIKEEEAPRLPLLERVNLKERTQDAIRECEIKPSREVMDALTGYCTDHYELANMIGIALGDDFNKEGLELILNREDGVVEQSYFERFMQSYQTAAFPAPPSAESGVRLLAYAKLKEVNATTEDEKKEARDTLLRCVSATINETLFQETSLGITTLKDEELRIIDELLEKLIPAVEGSSARTTNNHNGHSINWPVNNASSEVGVRSSESIKNIIKDRQKHFWNDCRMAGQLELHNTGHLPLIARRGNILLPRTEQHRRYGTMHVQTAVRDNMHSVVPHFAERLDDRGYKSASNNDHKYKTTEGDGGPGTILIPLADIIRVAPYARDAHYAVVEQRDPERVLVSPPTPNNIESIGNGEPDKEGYSGKDRVFFASEKLEGNPDSYAIELGSTCTFLFTDADLPKSLGYGSGYGFPVIVRAETPGEASHKVYEAQQRALEQPIYKGKIIVPLRRHVFDFIPENMTSAYNVAGRKGPLYNTNPLLENVS